MKLNQNKKEELLSLHSCSKDLLIWIQLQTLQEDIIEITHKHYTEDVKVSLNTFKKALGGLLDNKILFATSKKGKFKLNKDFIADSYFYHSGLGDFNQGKMWVVEPSRIPMLDYKPYDKSTIDEVKQEESLFKLKPEILERLKTESIEDIKKDLLKSKEEESIFVKLSKKQEDKLKKLKETSKLLDEHLTVNEFLEKLNEIEKKYPNK